MKTSFRFAILALLAALLVSMTLPGGGVSAAPVRQAEDPNPPDQPVRLVFIHHSTGGNWLADPADNELGGDLGRALMENNYYVSATNYGWGPDSIGDATDIPNWLDWFRGENSARYLDALYSEAGQNFGDFGSWPRLDDDPGGENTVILFKSCFPNSDLEGSPDDPPDPDGWLSVGHAKYVYNEILQYFATRPDKLFVVITAPPLIDSAYAENARAFNQWLVYDWLAENNYPYNNVAVFDFYNVLTGPNNHHRWNGGEIEHVFTEGMNTEYYPSGDDHPNAAGNRKATEEFVPLLNIFYHRWQEGSAQLPPVEPPPSGGGEAEPGPPSGGTGGPVADFETTGLEGWNANRDESAPSAITCNPQGGTTRSGSGALQTDFDIPPGTWGTCVMSYNDAQDWTAGEGLGFYLRASRASIPYNLLVFSGTPEEWATYIVYTETPAGSDGNWVYVEYPWGDFIRAEWEANGGSPFESTDTIFAVGFGFDGLESENNTGTVWVDDIQLTGTDVEEQPAPGEEESGDEGGGGGFPCVGSLLLPLLAVALAWASRRK